MIALLEDYRVELDYYSGPLDLLLFLVRKHEIDLNDIPIAKLTDQYLEHLRHIESLDINLASEFLVMAATLLEIKSQMLAPKVEAQGEAVEGELAGADGLSEADPRYELVMQLLAYKRFKDAANALDQRREEWGQRFARRPGRGAGAMDGAIGEDSEDEGDRCYAASGGDNDGGGEQVEIELDDVSIADLCEAFSRILESIGQGQFTHDVKYDDTPIALHADDIVDRLTREGPMSLQSIFVGRQTRGEMIGLFLATLELVKLKRIRVVQDRIAGEIQLELRPAQEQLQATDDKPADWTDPATGQVQYEWPSEQARQRAERRAHRRAKFHPKGQPAEEEDPDEPFIEIKRESLDQMLEQVESPGMGALAPMPSGRERPGSLDPDETQDSGLRTQDSTPDPSPP